MASYGVTPAGFVVPPLSSILAGMQAQVLATVDPQYDLSPNTPDGQILGIVANQYASLWELAQVCWNSYNREDVEGAGLDNLGDITGTPREGPSFTQVVAQLLIATGTYAASTWDPTTSALTSSTLVANVAGAQTFTFANAETFTVAAYSGTVDVTSGSPAITFSVPQTIPVGTVLWFESQPGVPYTTLAAITASTTCTLTTQYTGGSAPTTTAIPATYTLFQSTVISTTPSVNAGTLTDITTPVTGWYTVNNVLAQSQLGTDGELDAAYALRQAQDVAAEGSCTSAATAAALNELGAAQTPPVSLTVTVLENTENFAQLITGVLMPPHTYLASVYDGGTGWATSTAGQAAIGAVIYANKPAGISSAGVVGAVQVPIQDPYLGAIFVYYFSPVQLPLYISSTIAIRSGYVWSQVEAAIQQALVSAAVAPDLSTGQAPVGQLAPGADVIGSQLSAVIAGVPGVYDIQSLTFGFSVAPVNTSPLLVSGTQVATVLPANIALVQGRLP
jgi:hypothetical protein